MTKRFKYILGDGFTDFDVPILPSEVVYLLNFLTAENKQLAKDVERQNKYKQNYIEKAKWLNERLDEKLKENEQLKRTIDEQQEEIARQKYAKKMMRDNIKDYEKAIKRLRKSYEEFDKMRLDRIRFLERRLEKNGLSIYVNDCSD